MNELALQSRQTEVSAIVETEKKTTPAPTGRRFHELDAVRGIASLIVVFQHFAELFAAPISAGLATSLRHGRWGGEQFVTLLKISPFGVIIRGSSAVATFFVLSGFVLALPFLSTKGPVSWPGFVLKRIVRLYLPFLGGFVLCVLGYSVFSRHGIGGLNAWFNSSWNSPLEFQDVLSHAFLINHIDYSKYNKAFWTLAYEMQMSLIFPALFWLSSKLTSRWLAVLSFLLMLMGATHLPHTTVHNTFLAVVGMFLLGIGLARNRSYLADRWGHLPRGTASILTIAALLSYNYAPSLGRLSSRIGITAALLGLTSAVVVVMALTDRRWSEFLGSASCQFLGRISYSLYLSHLTVLYILIYASYEQMYSRLGSFFWPSLFVAYIVMSLLFAWIFFHAIERPCTLLSQRVSWWRRSKSVSDSRAYARLGVAD